MKTEWSVDHYAYCGMHIPRGRFEARADASAKFKAVVAHFKKYVGGEVHYKGPVTAELCEPDYCFMVPDSCGILEMRKKPIK